MKDRLHIDISFVLQNIPAAISDRFLSQRIVGDVSSKEQSEIAHRISFLKSKGMPI